MEETDFYLNDRLYVTHYQAISDKYVIFVPPLFEELARTRKLMVNMARDLSHRGVNVIRFDYYGTGLSYGRFGEFSLSGAIRDIKGIVSYCKKCNSANIQFLGLRFGGYLAIKYLIENSEIEKAVLWEPIFDLTLYWEDLMRIAVSNQLITYSAVKHGKRELISMLKENGEITIDGYPVSSSMYGELIDSGVYSHEKLSDFKDRIATIFWRNRKDHENIMRSGIRSHYLSVDKPSWDSIKYINSRFPELFIKTINEILHYDNADVRV